MKFTGDFTNFVQHHVKHTVDQLSKTRFCSTLTEKVENFLLLNTLQIQLPDTAEQQQLNFHPIYLILKCIFTAANEKRHFRAPSTKMVASTKS